MPTTEPDLRSESRKALDEQLASEPHLPHSDVPAGEQPRHLEEPLRHRRPVAVIGVVENGLVRLLDPHIRLPEKSRVIVVASEREPSRANVRSWVEAGKVDGPGHSASPGSPTSGEPVSTRCTG